LALCGLTSLAHAGPFEDYTHNATFCKDIADEAVDAYNASQNKAMQEAVPWTRTWQSWIAQDPAQTSPVTQEAYEYAIRYAYTQASSDQDAYTTGYSHCMDALN